MILGIDEVGRGPWAGPLVVGAVVLGNSNIEGLTDSKKLSKRKREELSGRIISDAAAFGLGWVSAAELDNVGLAAALRLATRRAVEQIHVPYYEIIIDGTINFLAGTTKEQYVTTLKKADLLISSVSAASIIAKVARDDYMEQLDDTYPEYEFSRHVGYGTALHRTALQKHGVTPEHRKSFAPIAKLTGADIRSERYLEPAVLTSGAVGEQTAATWLKDNGYEILERNWKTRFCEIDIIATKNNVLYFVEVKHRRQSRQGGGIAAITPRKLRQMKFAAAVYQNYKKATLNDAQLAVITTTGDETILVESFLLLDE